MNDPIGNGETISVREPVRLVNGIEIHEFRTSFSAKSYLLQVDHRNYSITPELFTLINLIDGCKSLQAIAEEYSLSRKKKYSAEDVAAIVQNFLAPNGIVQGDGVIKGDTNKKYLRFRIPLISSSLINRLVKPLRPLFNKYIFAAFNVLLLAVHVYIGMSLGKREFEDLMASPNMFFIASVIAFLSCFIHEFGHATATSFYHAKPGAIGFGIYLYIPVFYSDVSDVWKIDRYKRAIVDYAGMYFQFIFNCLLFACYLWSGSKIYLFSIIFISLHTVSNMNPFFRFDGYWLLSDLLGIPNLRSKVNEVLGYYKSKIVGVPRPKPAFLNGLEPRIRNVLLLYVLTSNLFFAYILVNLLILFPSVLKEYPSFVYTVATSMLQTIAELDLKSFAGILFEFIMHSIPIAFVLYIIYSPVKALVRYLLAYGTRTSI